MDRGQLLRLGAAGALGALASPAAAAAARPPSPQGDDVGYVQWAATAELVCLALWQRALAARRFGPAMTRRIGAMRDADRRQLTALSAVLGEEAPSERDFTVVLPRRAFRSRAGILALATEVEQSITRASLAGVAGASDPAIRLLLGKLLVQHVQHLDALRATSSAFAGLHGPLELEQAGAWLDRYLRPTA